MGFFTDGFSLRKLISPKKHNQESGNVFLMLFGAVGMVGIIGASTMTVMKGPVRTMSQVTKRTIAENSMIAAGKLALVAAAQDTATSDCDTDNTVEPFPYITNIAGLPGGGEIPSNIGVSKQDPWGTEFGYCVWDHGTAIDDAGCGGAGQTRLQGVDTAISADEYVLAIVSAGPDRMFNTTCNDYIDIAPADSVADVPLLDKTAGSDDLVLGYTYAEAGAIAGGLWLEDGASGAKIARTIRVEDGGNNTQFEFNPFSQLLTVGDGVSGTGRFPIAQTDNLRQYSGAAGGTINVDSELNSGYDFTTTADIAGTNLDAGGSINLSGTDNIILNSNYLSGDGGDEGISIDASGNVTASNDLTVTNNFTANALTSTTTTDVGTDLTVDGNTILGDNITDTVGIAGNTTIGGTLGAGATTLSSLSVTGNANVDGNTALGNAITDITTISGNAAFGGTLQLNTAVAAGTCAALADEGKIQYETGSNVVEYCNGVSWQSINTIASLDDIGDVNVPAPTDKFVLSWDNGASEWIAVSSGTLPAAETDPQVDTLNANDWCVANAGGTAIDCNASLPGETDPQVNTLTPNLWCSANAGGTAINCTNAAPGGAGTAAGYLTDADGDTLVQVEEGADDDTFRIDTDGAERMVILPTGEVGIGQSTPTSLLHLSGDGALNDIRLDNYGGVPNILFARANGTGALPTTVADTNLLGTFDFYGRDDTNFEHTASIQAIVNGAVAADTVPTDIVFSTSATNTAGLSEKMRIDSAGNIGIGTAGTANADALLQLDAADKGFLAPRMSDPATAIGATVEGLIAYDTVTDKYQYYDGIVWQDIGSSAAIPPDSIDWDDIIDAMTLDATTTIDMDTNAADFNFDNNTFVIDSSANAIGLGTAAPDATAILDMTSTTQGFLAPRMSTGARDAIVGPATGLTVYNTTTNTTDYFDGTIWKSFATSAGSAIELSDADGDTLVQVEEGADDDTIRFDTDGNEVMTIDPLGAVNMTADLTVGTTLDVGTALDVGTTLDVTGVTTLVDDLIVDTDTLFVDASGDNVGIGTIGPDTSAALDITSTNTGFLAPRMSNPSVSIAAPATGLIAYDTSTNKHQYFDGVIWKDIGTGAGITPDSIDWDDIIDAMTLDATTTIDMDTNAADFNFDLNTFVIDSSADSVGVGTNAPAYEFHVHDSAGGPGAQSAILLTTGDTGTTATDGLKIGYNNIAGNSAGEIWLYENQKLVFATNNTEKMRLEADGDLAIGTIAADSSAAVEIAATSQGFLAPRVSNPTVAIAAPATGLIAYNTVTDLYQFYDGTAWRDFGYGSTPAIPADSIDWDDIIDAMTLDATTTIDMDTNTADFNFDANTFVIDSSANRIGIGTNTPTETLTVGGVDGTDKIIAIENAAGTNRVQLRIDPGNNGSMEVQNSGGTSLFFVGNTRSHIFTAGGLTVGAAAIADTSAELDVQSTSKGFLAPRVSDPTSAIAAPATGLMAYDTTTNRYKFYDGGAWQDFGSGVGGLWTDNTTHITRENFHIIDSGESSSTAGLDGDGTYSFYNPDKGAFRGGDIYAGVPAWQDGNIGTNSFAWGRNTRASGATSMALGENILASNALSIGFGRWIEATGNSAIGLGNDMRVSGDGSYGFANGNSAPNLRVLSGARSYGVFLGTGNAGHSISADEATVFMSGLQTGVDYSSNNTFGILGMSAVIDPSRPAGVSGPDASAALDIVSTDQGFLAPRVSDPTSAIAAPATGLIAYNTVTDLYEFYDGTAWRTMGYGVGGGFIDDLGDAATDYVTDFNMFMGQNAGASIAVGGQYNLAIGQDAGNALTTGDRNIAIGWNSLGSATGANENIMIGYNTGANISNALANTGIGINALSSNNGNSNTAVGYGASGHTNGANNATFGNNAGTYLRTGNQNTILGSDAGRGELVTFDYSGTNNVIIGFSAAVDLDATNDENTIIGANTAAGLTGGGSGNILLGYGVDVATATSSNELNIGDAIFGNLTNKQIAVNVADATAIDASAILQADSTDRGFLAPRVSDPTSAIAAPATGLIAYNTATDLYEFYDGTTWRTMGYGAPVSGFIDDLGDAATDYVTDFNMFMGQNAGASIAGGQHNLAIGQNAGDTVTTGDNNITLGYNAGTGITTQDNIIAIGKNTLSTASVTNSNNVGIGSDVMSSVNGGFNIAMGSNAMETIGSASNNIALGSFALRYGAGNDNIVLGWGALSSGGAGTRSENIALGTRTGQSLTTGSGNLFLGHKTGELVTDGSNNIVLGYDLDASSANASYEINLGNTLYGNIDDPGTGGVDETQFGVGVADATAIDASALVEFDSANRGFLAPRVSDPTSAIAAPATGLIAYNTVTDLYEFYDGTAWRTMGYGVGGGFIDDLGDAATDYVTDFNMFMGQNAGASIAVGGQYNLAIGQDAGDALTSGDYNIAIGYNAAGAITTTSDAIAIGYNALDAATAGGGSNIAIGTDALGSAAGTTRESVAIGAQSLATLNNNQTGNVAVGHWAGRRIVGAQRSVFLGSGAGDSAATPIGIDDSVMIGHWSGHNIDDNAINNIFIGYTAGDLTTTGTDNLIIGYNADASSATASYELNLGSTLYGNIDDPGTGGIDETQFGVGVADATAIDASALVEFDSANRGFLAPRVSDPTSAIAAPATGLIAYNTVTDLYQFYDGTAWRNFGYGASVGDRIQDGDNDTYVDVDTGDDDVIRFWTNGGERMTIQPGGRVNIATEYTAYSWRSPEQSASSYLQWGSGGGAHTATLVNANRVLMRADNGVSQYIHFAEAADSDYVAVGDTSQLYVDIQNDSVGINTGSPDASAALDIVSTDTGFLAPRVSDPTSAIAAPATGLIAYNTVTDLYQFYDGTAWRDFGYGASVVIPPDSIDWDDMIDAMTLDATTTIDMDTNTADFNFDNNTFVIDSSANAIGIGTNTPYSDLEVNDVAGSGVIGITGTSATGAAVVLYTARPENDEGLGISLENPTGGNKGWGLGGIGDSYAADPTLQNSFVLQYYNGANNGIFPFLADENGSVIMGGAFEIADASALLELKADDKGFLAPRVSDPTSAIAAPATGLIAYNTATDFYQYYDGTAWRNFGYGATGLWTDNTTHITRENFHILNSGLAAGSTTAGLDGDGTYSFYDPDKGAMRGGTVSSGVNYWQDVNIGSNSFAWGERVLASGDYSFTLGWNARALGDYSYAIGSQLEANGTGNYALGRGGLGVNGTNNFGYAQGNSAIVAREINGNFNYGVFLNTGSTGHEISADYSTVFMSGDQSGVNYSTDSSFGILGMSVVIDPTSPAGVSGPDASAALDIVSSNQGFLAPRMSDPSADIAAPATGLIAYDLVDDELQYYNGTVWVSAGGDNLGDHTATTNLDMDSNNIIGTTMLSFVGVAGNAPTK